MILWFVAYPLSFQSAVLLATPVLFSIVGLVSHDPFWIFQHPRHKIPDIGCLSFLKYQLDFSDIFFESFISFWETPTRARICESLGYLVDQLPEVRTLLYFFRTMVLNCSDGNFFYLYHFLLLVSIYPPDNGHTEVE